MTQNSEEETRKIFEMPPELSALEAALGTFCPTGSPDDAARTRSAILLEQCRLIEADLTPESRRERLVETIEQASKEEISLSLNQYAKQLRFVSTLTGGIVGFFLGILFAFLGIAASVHWLTPPPSPSATPVREIRYYLNQEASSSQDFRGADGFSFEGSGERNN